MSLFSKFTKNNNTADKLATYPWSQRKLTGSQSHVLPRHGHATTVSLPTNNLVLFGGTHNKSKKDLFLIDTNNMSSHSINATGDVPASRMYPILAPLGNNCVLLYGGQPSSADEKWDPNFYTLNVGTRQWSRIQMPEGHLPVERSGHSVAVSGNLLYIWGGQRAGRYLDDLFTFDANTYEANPQWEHIASANEGPTGRSGHASVVFDDKLYIFGGTDGSHLYNDIWMYDLHTRYWSQISAVGCIPVPREGCAASLVGDVMYVFGGRGPDGNGLGDLCAFKIRGNRWFMFQNMGPSPSPRFNMTFTAFGDKTIAIGGETGIGKADESPYLAHLLDCSRIRYPPENQQTNNSSSPALSLESSSDPTKTMQKPSVERLQQQRLQQSSPAPRMESPTIPFTSREQQQVENTSTIPNNITTNSSNTPTTNINTTATTATTAASNTTSNVTTVSASTSETNIASRHRSLHPEQINTTPQRPPRHMSMVPSAALRRPRTTSPLPSQSDEQTLSPTAPKDDEKPRPSSPAGHPSPQRPPRPSREGVSLNNKYRKDTVSMFPDSHIATSAADAAALLAELPSANNSTSASTTTSAAGTATTEQDENELKSLILEIKAQDAIIHSMKKKEPWWRSEVSMARKMRMQDSFQREHPTMNHPLVEQIAALKTELKRTQTHIGEPATHQAMSAKVQQTDRIRTAALQEAAYFKSKYIGLMERRRQQGEINSSDSEDDDNDLVRSLERSLAETLMENEANRRLLQQMNKQAQHDHSARESAEDRAKEAQGRAEEAQQAHERALEKLEEVHQRAAQGEAQVRENVNKIANLTNKLADSLSAPASNQMDEAKTQIMQLEQANSRVHEEAQMFKQQLASCVEDIQYLRIALEEREETLGQAMRQLEDTSNQVYATRRTLSERTPRNTAAAATTAQATASPTQAY